MKVFGTGVDTQPKKGRLAFRGGDICDPQDGEQLNGPPWPTKVNRWYCPLPIFPWLCINLFGYGFYVGWKCYGFDRDNYKNWCNGEFIKEVYPGSLALELTVRFFTDG